MMNFFEYTVINFTGYKHTCLEFSSGSYASLNSLSRGNENITVGTLPKGLYIVKLLTNEGVIERKILKKLKPFIFTNKFTSMKKQILLSLCLSLYLIGNAQVSKIIKVSTPGTLTTLLSATEKSSVSNLTITGNIDVRDFKCMRDEITLLSVLNISGVTIAAYTGTAGTFSTSSTSYPANTIPDFAFHYLDNTGKTSLTSVVLPNSITSIGSSAFDTTNGLKSITIPSTVTSLSDNAFWGCSALNSIYIPSSVVSIGTAVFSTSSCLITVDAANPNYSSINGVLFNKYQTTLIQCPITISGAYTIPSTVTTIGQEAFNSCSSISSITIPSSVNTINDYAFNWCNNLLTVNLPSTLTKIGNYAFYYCEKLQSINIPSSITSIGGAAFLGCWGLFTVDANNSYYTSVNGILFNKTQTTLIQCPISKSGSFTISSSVSSIANLAFVGSNCLVDVDTQNPNYSALDGVLFNKNKTKLLYYPISKVGSYTIPSTVTALGNWSFYGCNSLTSINIPSSVITYGSGVFKICYGLNSIHINATTPVDLSSNSELFYNIFYGVNKSTCTLYVPTGSKAVYQSANQWQDFMNIVEMTTAVIQINGDIIKLYPNPVNDYFCVTGIAGMALVTVYDINGKIVLTKQTSENENIDAGKLSKGLYIVKLSTVDGIIQGKMVKK